jgi:hypothetical protein
LAIGSGFLAGSLPWLALPLLAQSSSPVVWGDPSTPRGLWWLMSGMLYRANLLGADISTRLAPFASLLLRQLLWVGCVPLLWAARIRSTWPWFACAALYVVYSIGYDSDDAAIFMLPGLMLLIIPLAIGLRPLGRFALILPAIALALHLFGAWSAAPSSVRSEALFALADLPEDALAITGGDSTIFTLWYFQHVEGVRPDVTLVDSNLFAFDWYRVHIKRQDNMLRAWSVDDIEAFASVNATLRPVCRVMLRPEPLVSCVGTLRAMLTIGN